MTSPLVSEYGWKLQNAVRDFIVLYLCCVTNHYLLNLQRIMLSFSKKINKENLLHRSLSRTQALRHPLPESSDSMTLTEILLCTCV